MLFFSVMTICSKAEDVYVYFARSISCITLNKNIVYKFSLQPNRGNAFFIRAHDCLSTKSPAMCLNKRPKKERVFHDQLLLMIHIN